MCDASGKPVHITVSGGNESDIYHAKQCLEPIVKKGAMDRGCDADHLRDWLRACKVKVCIPPRKTAKNSIDIAKKLYKTRNLVERCFNRPSHRCKQRLPGSDQGLAFIVVANLSMP